MLHHCLLNACFCSTYKQAKRSLCSRTGYSPLTVCSSPLSIYQSQVQNVRERRSDIFLHLTLYDITGSISRGDRHDPTNEQSLSTSSDTRMPGIAHMLTSQSKGIKRKQRAICVRSGRLKFHSWSGHACTGTCSPVVLDIRS